MSARDAHSEEMDRLLRYLGACDPLELDTGTADRLLDGTMAGDDAPRAYAGVARALATLRTAPTAAELSGETEAVSRIAAVIAADTIAYQESHRARSRRRRRTKTRRRAATLVLAAAVGVGLLSGLAAANALPRGAQGVAAEVLDTVGVSVPNPDVPAFTNPPSVNSGPAGPGLAVSSDAQSTPATGHGKGASVSSEASNGNGGGHAYGRDNASTNAGPDANGNGNGNAYGRDETSATNSGNGNGNGADPTTNPGHAKSGGEEP
jgi:hypothetical protein